MAFSDPQSITVSAVANSMPRTGNGPGTGEFTSADGAYTLSLLHTRGKRQRNSYRVVTKKYVTDPLRPAENIPVQAAVVITLDRPPQGFTNADLLAFAIGFLTSLTASSNANLTKLIGFEN